MRKIISSLSLLFFTLLFSLPVFSTSEENESSGVEIEQAITQFEILLQTPAGTHEDSVALLEIAELIASRLYDDGDILRARDFSKRAASMAFDIDSVNRGIENTNVALSIYYESGSEGFNEGIAYGDSVLKRLASMPHRHIETCIHLRAHIANMQYDLGRFEDSNETNVSILPVAEELYGKNTKEYYLRYMDYGVTLSAIDPISGMRVIEESVDALSRMADPADPFYINACMNLAQCYINFGRYEDARDLFAKATVALDKSDAKEADSYRYYAHSKYAIVLWYLGDVSSCDVEMNKAINQYLELKNGVKDVEYYTMIHNYSVFLCNDNPGKALELELEAVSARERILGPMSRDYIGSLNNLRNVLVNLRRYDEAYDYAEKALDLTAKTLGENSFEYLQVAGNLLTTALNSPGRANHESLKKASRNYIPIFRNFVKRNFQQLSSEERPAFWQSVSTETIPLYQLLLSSSDSSIRRAAYDASLFNKGVLLSTDVEFQRLLSESSDPELKRIIQNINENNLILDNSADLPMETREVVCDSLLAANKRLELRMQEKVLDVADFTSVFDISSTDVQRALRPGEAAVEIVSNISPCQALVLRPGSEPPVSVTLFTEDEISACRSDAEFSERIFSPLLPELKDVKTLYFSPAGILNKLPLESYILPGDSLMVSEKWNFYRLSSTRELTRRKNGNVGKSAGIFGGMDFDNADNSALKFHSPDKFSSMRDLTLTSDLNLRAGAGMLPATKVEAEFIREIMDSKGISVESFIGAVGTEEAFKQRSGKADRIIHVATHGFYSDASALSALKDSNGRKLSAEEISLSRSGLLFSGANKALMGLEIPAETEDGILTADEISRMNLNGVDLVVLSACETGLGDISSEGVFGLQRGFKKAGVNSLLMSLWKVDDKATQMLMTNFYKYFLGGKSKRESLLLAQKSLREYEETIEIDRSANLTPSQRRQMERRGEKIVTDVVKQTIRPYADPRYWAAFILLDARD